MNFIDRLFVLSKQQINKLVKSGKIAKVYDEVAIILPEDLSEKVVIVARSGEEAGQHIGYISVKEAWQL